MLRIQSSALSERGQARRELPWLGLQLIGVALPNHVHLLVRSRMLTFSEDARANSFLDRWPHGRRALSRCRIRRSARHLLLWASGIFTITVTVFAGAIVGAAASRGPSRIAWLGFGIFGWTYLYESVSAADCIRNTGRIAATNWEANNEVWGGVFFLSGDTATVDTSARGQADASRRPSSRKSSSSAIRSAWATLPGSPSGSPARRSSSARRRTAATARNVLAHLDEWVLRQKPDVVHLNCGLHDLKRSKTDGHHQVELDRYAENLRRIVARIRAGTDAALVFADTTPILDERHARRGADFDRTEADVRRYNAAATAIMGELGVPVHDLHWVVEQGGPETMLGPDGTHYTAAGSDRLAEAVADCVLRQVTVRRYRPLPRPASGPQAAAEYRKAAAQRDALVPEVYRRLKVGEFRIPADAAAWKEQRPTVLRTVLDSLGDLPPRPSPPRARIISRELRPGYTLEKVSLDNGVDGEVTALMLLPEAGSGRCRRSSGSTPRPRTRRR